MKTGMYYNYFDIVQRTEINVDHPLANYSGVPMVSKLNCVAR